MYLFDNYLLILRLRPDSRRLHQYHLAPRPLEPYLESKTSRRGLRTNRWCFPEILEGGRLATFSYRPQGVKP